ncbi:hypothetical protein O1611_g3212 [Lasiodiplodia mahajangana]|uniref:Uncharacterized protein n=1 Tax=Lasiodiplodia mahajangana TaxID=1108764 RepID=A0ACC2JSE8_9PEZI|nr:hypothetical protein O1611_g3212 [Lasiodiplodia mahajangana]
MPRGLTSAPPPNGGLQAWVQVVGSVFMFMASWGTLNTFGVFQTYYQENFLSAYTPADISWIGTVQGFLLIIIGVLSGPIYDLGYLKHLIFTGAILVVLGLLTASVAYHYYSIFLSLGIAVGLVFRRLLDTVGYGWACRTLGLILAGLLVISLAISKPYGPPALSMRRLIDPRALSDPSFLFFTLALFFAFIGFYVPFFYISDYAQAETGASAQYAFYLLAIQNAGSAFGRVIPNIIAVRAGALPILLGCMLITTILAFSWPGTSNVAGITVFSILYGFFSGGVVSLLPSAFTALSPDLSAVGSRFGMCFSFAGLGLLIGNPIAGVIVSKDRGYLGQALFTGSTVFVGFLFMLMATTIHRKRQVKSEASDTAPSITIIENGS